MSFIFTKRFPFPLFLLSLHYYGVYKFLIKIVKFPPFPSEFNVIIIFFLDKIEMKKDYYKVIEL